jgi:hypothetical protein
MPCPACQRRTSSRRLQTSGTPQVGPRWDCIGYAAFVQAIADQQTAICRWIQPLIRDINELATNYDAHESRIIAMQHRLVELIDLIDPAGDRIPIDQREKM